MKCIACVLVLQVLFIYCETIFSLEYCNNGLVCPTSNTCCENGCIPSDLGSYNATCCDDGISGCGVSYLCTDDGFCDADASVRDPLVQRLPRYRLCSSNKISQVHGFRLSANDSCQARLAYYSSHGNIQSISRVMSTSIRAAVVMVHGAGRNADDYFCSTVTAIEQQTAVPAENVLLVVPRFAAVLDSDLELLEGGIAMRWANEESGPWRYGANAVWPEEVSNTSSYDCMDKIVALLLNKKQFPNIKQLTIAGHSSGGQFVQRYSLLTSTWDDNRTRGVVANPSSYAYLSAFRMTDGVGWTIPSGCSGYNQWEWGLTPGGNYTTQYVDLIFRRVSIRFLRDRYRNRTIIYLAGSRDICNVSDHDTGWCYSHGLETRCMDELQGIHRLQRHIRYLASLDCVGVPYKNFVVAGVGHDHSLIFNSENGTKSLLWNSGKPEVDQNAKSSHTTSSRLLGNGTGTCWSDWKPRVRFLL